MSNKITGWLSGVAVIGILAAGTVSADYQAESWKYSKSISLPSFSGDAAFVKVKLDREVLSQSSLSDIRIISGGKEAGYQLVTENDSVRNAYYSSELLNLSSQGGNTMFILDLKTAGQVHGRISITSPSQNFKRQVSVYSADSRLGLNDSGWRLLTDKGYVYNFTDLQANFTAGSGDVSYPQNTSRYLKVVVGNGEGSDFRVTAARVYRYDIQSAETDTVRIVPTTLENKQAKTTELLFDLGSSGIPTREVVLSTAERGFSRRAAVQSSNDGLNWRMVGQGSLFNLSTPLFSGSELTLTYSEQTSQFIRVVVFNEDNQPVAFDPAGIFQSVARYAVFEARPGMSYTFVYGNPLAAKPQYDISRFFEYIESRNLPVAILGAAVSNPQYMAPAGPIIPVTERYPYLLPLVLVMLVLVVGAFIVLYVLKLNKTPAGPDIG